MPQDVTLPNSINTANFWHIFYSGSKFKILKPNSSSLTFGISKFVSLSISCFLFLFLQLFYIVLSYTNIVLSFWLLHLKITTILAITSQNYYHFGYYISNSPLSAITSQITTFSYNILNLSLLAIPLQNLFFIYCIKLNIDTNHHIRHYSCKS